MTYDDLIKHFGNQAAIASKVGITQPRVSSWKKAGQVPYGYQCQFQLLTGGHLQAQPIKAKESA